MWRHNVLLALLVVLPASFTGCKGVMGALVGAPSTTLTISNKITSLPAGQTYQFNIDEQHDQGAGFTFTLNGKGTLLQNGPGLEYIAPPSPPSPSTVTVTVTAANGSGVSDSDTFTIAAATGPVVSISPSTFTVTGGGSPVTLNITVTQDSPSDQLTGGVSGSPDCGGACGSLGAFNGTAGGGSYTVLFIPPKSVTATTVQQVQVFSSLANSTSGLAFVTENVGSGGTSSGCTLQGYENAMANHNSGEQWMFLVRGSDAGHSMAMVAMFEPDGKGGITSGVEDINVSGSAPDTNEAILPSQSGYSVDSTGRGCLQLGTSKGTKVFRFGMEKFSQQSPSPTSGQIAEYDDTNGTGTRALGRMQIAVSAGTGYNNSLLGNSSCIFGLEGFDNAGGHVAVAGNLEFDGAGNLTSGLVDANDAGSVTSRAAVPASTYSVSMNGRVTLSFMNGLASMNYVLYAAYSQAAFIIMSTDPVSATVPMLSGRMINSSGFGLPGPWILGESGKVSATIGTANLAQGGTFTASLWQDAGGTTGTSQVSGTHTVTDVSQGRVTFSGTHPLVAYVAGGAGTGRGFTVSNDNDANGGNIYQLPSPPNFSDATFSNNAPNPPQDGYGDIQIFSAGITTAVGVISFDGQGGLSGKVDVSSPTGLTPNAGFVGAYTINSDGSGTINSFPLVTDGTRILFIDEKPGVVQPRVSTIMP
jgi:hypothetical protein